MNHLTVSRETLAELAVERGLAADAADRFACLLTALEDEVDPPTAIQSGDEAIDVHIADSLSALDVAAVAGALRLADIGAGAGFPGLVLAVALPQASVDLVESGRRKCEVIDRLAAAAGLHNARAVAARAEEWGGAAGAGAYDLVTARALAPLAVIAEYAAPLLEQGGSLVAYKGERDRDEEAAATRAATPLGLEPAEVTAVVPFAGSRTRHLYRYAKVAPTPDRFPRRPGMARKRPLAT